MWWAVAWYQIIWSKPVLSVAVCIQHASKFSQSTDRLQRCICSSRSSSIHALYQPEYWVVWISRLAMKSHLDIPNGESCSQWVQNSAIKWWLYFPLSAIASFGSFIIVTFDRCLNTGENQRKGYSFHMTKIYRQKLDCIQPARAVKPIWYGCSF